MMTEGKYFDFLMLLVVVWYVLSVCLFPVLLVILLIFDPLLDPDKTPVLLTLLFLTAPVFLFQLYHRIRYRDQY